MGTCGSGGHATFHAQLPWFDSRVSRACNSDCDLGRRGSLSYREFRRFLGDINHQQSAHLTPKKAMRLGNLRVAARGILELVNQCEADGASVEAAIERALRQRGRSLQSRADAK